jgi:hypothetical protein
MSTLPGNQRRWSLERLVAVGAIAVGVAAGSYGIASAASGSGSSSASGSGAGDVPIASTTPSAPSAHQPWGGQRSDETLLTDGTATKVKEAALAKLPGAAIVRVETDADGNAAYEAHVVKSDGTPATVYVNAQFDVVSVESGMPGPPSGGAAPSSGAAA